MPSTNPNSPKRIQTPVRTLAGGLLIDSTGRVVGRGSTPEDAARIAEALNDGAKKDEAIRECIKAMDDVEWYSQAEDYHENTITDTDVRRRLRDTIKKHGDPNRPVCAAPDRFAEYLESLERKPLSNG